MAGVAAYAGLAACVGGGQLAAAALPSAARPRVIAELESDSSAKELARTAETTAVTYGVEHLGSYAGLTVAKAERLEPTLRSSAGAKLISVVAHAASFRVTTQATVTRQTFSITWSPSAKVTMSCSGTIECVRGRWASG